MKKLYFEKPYIVIQRFLTRLNLRTKAIHTELKLWGPPAVPIISTPYEWLWSVGLNVLKIFELRYKVFQNITFSS